jgi:transmembrane sensor
VIDSIVREQSVKGVQNVRMQAATWLQRRQFWNWSDADQAELDHWLAESASHQIAYMRVKAVWGRTERLTALRQSTKPPYENGSRSGGSRFIRGVAAIVAILLVGFIGARYLTGVRQSTWTTAVGGRRVLSLLDGSKIELNTNTVLRIASDQRAAWLDQGEAYFQIKHDGAHPFVVTVSGRRVVDMGTKFLIKDNGNELEVALVEGRARIEPAKGQADAQNTILAPGDVATATGNSLAIVKKPTRVLANELSWRRDLLVFDNATLGEVATELNRYNREKFVIADSGIARRKIDASIPTHGVQAFKRVARDFLGLRVEDRGQEIIVSR